MPKNTAASRMSPAEVARGIRREANKAKAKYVPRSELTEDQLKDVRAKGTKRQKEYLKRKRIEAGLPIYSRPGRPRKDGGEP